MRLLLLAIIASAFALMLLPGCLGGGITRQDYDALKNSCDLQKSDSQQALAEEQTARRAAEGNLASCDSEKSNLQGRIADKQKEIDALRPYSQLVEQAKNKTIMISQYELLRSYYLDAFGAGNIVNSAKIRRIELQLSSIGDQQLAAAWPLVKNCGGITDCENAKRNFVSALDGRISAIQKEITAMFQVEGAAGQQSAN